MKRQLRAYLYGIETGHSRLKRFYSSCCEPTYMGLKQLMSKNNMR